jgi:hypothetical protein
MKFNYGFSYLLLVVVTKASTQHDMSDASRAMTMSGPMNLVYFVFILKRCFDQSHTSITKKGTLHSIR